MSNGRLLADYTTVNDQRANTVSRPNLLLWTFLPLVVLETMRSLSLSFWPKTLTWVSSVSPLRLSPPQIDLLRLTCVGISQQCWRITPDACRFPRDRAFRDEPYHRNRTFSFPPSPPPCFPLRDISNDTPCPKTSIERLLDLPRHPLHPSIDGRPLQAKGRSQIPRHYHRFALWTYPLPSPCELLWDKGRFGHLDKSVGRGSQASGCDR